MAAFDYSIGMTSVTSKETQTGRKGFEGYNMGRSSVLLHLLRLGLLKVVLGRLHLLHVLLSLHHLLLGHLGLLARLLSHSLLVLGSLLRLVLPDQLEHFVGIVGSDRRPDLASLEHDFDELFFVLAISVEREPVVEVFPADSPSVADSLRVDESDGLHFREEYGFGGGEREEVLVDDYEFPVDLDLLILIEKFSHDSKIQKQFKHQLLFHQMASGSAPAQEYQRQGINSVYGGGCDRVVENILGILCYLLLLSDCIDDQERDWSGWRISGRLSERRVLVRCGGREEASGCRYTTGLLFWHQKGQKMTSQQLNIKSLSGCVAARRPHQQVEGTSQAQDPASPVLAILLEGDARDEHHDDGVEEGENPTPAILVPRGDLIGGVE